MERREEWARESERRWSATYELVKKFVSQAIQLITEAKISPDDYLNLIRVLLLARVVSCTEAIALLAKNGFLLEAEMLTRSSLEGMIKLSALAKNGSMLLAYLGEEFPIRRRAMSDIKNMLRDVENPTPTMDEIDQALASIDRQEAQFKEKNGVDKCKEVKVWDWAVVGGQTEIFWALYLRLSSAVHYSSKSLERRMVFSKDKDRVESIVLYPDTASPEEIIRDSLVILAKALAAFAEALSLKITEEMQESWGHVNAMFDNANTEGNQCS